MQPRGQIGDRNADAHRPLARQAGDRHQAAHALGDLIEARPVAIGAVLTEAGNAGVDDALVDLAQRLVVDAEALFHVGAEILHHHVGLGDQAAEGGKPLRRLQVERDAALVAVQILEVGTIARPAGRLAPFEMRRGLDLDHIGAPVGELPHRGGARTHAGEVENRETRKGLRGPGKLHFRYLRLERVQQKWIPVLRPNALWNLKVGALSGRLTGVHSA